MKVYEGKTLETAKLITVVLRSIVHNGLREERWIRENSHGGFNKGLSIHPTKMEDTGHRGFLRGAIDDDVRWWAYKQKNVWMGTTRDTTKHCIATLDANTWTVAGMDQWWSDAEEGDSAEGLLAQFSEGVKVWDSSRPEAPQTTCDPHPGLNHPLNGTRTACGKTLAWQGGTTWKLSDGHTFEMGQATLEGKIRDNKALAILPNGNEVFAESYIDIAKRHLGDSIFERGPGKFQINWQGDTARVTLAYIVEFAEEAGLSTGDIELSAQDANILIHVDGH